MLFREVFIEQFESITDCSMNTSQQKGKSMTNSIVHSQNIFELRQCSLNIEVEPCSLQEALVTFNTLPLGETKNTLGAMIEALVIEQGVSKKCFRPPFNYINY
jgi:hypothetical protein